MLAAATFLQRIQPPPHREIDPRILNQYAIKLQQKLTFPKQEIVGEGCYGSVYIVNVNGAICIAKRLQDILMGRGREEKVRLEQKEVFHKNFVRECVLLSEAKHPNIVQFIGVHYGVTKYDLTLLMEQLHTDLEKYIESNPAIPIATKASILYGISCGLLYLHEECSIIHRDLTAANILLTADNRAKIADLGVSRIFNRTFSQLSKIPGTLAYMPPEALKDEPRYNESLDIFSFGVLILFLCIQKFPEFSWENVPDPIVEKHEGEIYKRKKWIDKMETKQPELKRVIVWCLCDDPFHRPSTVSLNILFQEMNKDFN